MRNRSLTEVRLPDRLNPRRPDLPIATDQRHTKRNRSRGDNSVRKIRHFVTTHQPGRIRYIPIQRRQPARCRRIIALGVGASTTVFSLVNSVLVKPLPFQDPGRLVWIANKTNNEDSMSGRTVQVSPMVALRDS